MLVAPITSQHYTEKINHRIQIFNYEKYNLKTPSIILNQIKLVDKNLLEKINNRINGNFFFTLPITHNQFFFYYCSLF